MDIREDFSHIIDRLTILDDKYGRKFMEDIACLQLLVRMVTGLKGLCISMVETGKTIAVMGARTIIEDIYSKGTIGDRRFICNVEIQQDSRGAIPQRALFHGYATGATSLEPSDPFSLLPDIYVIFLTLHNVWHEVSPIHMENMELPGVGLHLIYLNLSYKGDDEIGRLVHDIRCADPYAMYYDEFRTRAIYLKTTDVGRQEMSELLQSLFDKGERRGILKGIMGMASTGIDLNIIARGFNMSLSEVKSILESAHSGDGAFAARGV